EQSEQYAQHPGNGGKIHVTRRSSTDNGYKSLVWICSGSSESEKGEAYLEQLLNVASVLFIQQEHNHVVAGLHHHIVIGDDDFSSAICRIAHQRADGGTFRQIDILQRPSYHLRGFGIPVGDKLHGLRRPAAQ